MSPLEQTGWFLSFVLSAILVVKLAVMRLHRVYVWFFVFLCFKVGQSLVMRPLDPSTDLYAWAYFLTQPAKWFLCILVVLELYSLALGKHQGITSLSRWVLSAGLLFAVGVSALTLSVDLSHPAGPFPVLLYYNVIQRGLMFSLVLFLLLITAFLVWFPVEIRRNIVLHASVYSVYFLSSSMALFIHNVVGSGLTSIISTILLCVDDVCLLLWILLLNKRGENAVLVVRGRWRSEDAEKLAEQMEAVNTFLLGISRK